MKRIIILISVIILTAIAGLFIYPKVDRYFRQRPIKNADILRTEIIASIKNPFSQADTLILETQWMFCGNSDPDELPVVFDTKLGSEKYRYLLAKQVQTPVLTMSEFQKVMDTVRLLRFSGEYPPSLWDTCRIGKVSADIKAEQLSPRKIRLYENYHYADTVKYIRKDFKFNDDKWTYSIVDASLQILSE